jgi:hypothetical protein
MTPTYSFQEEFPPMITSYEKSTSELFAFADVKIQGDRPWDLQVHDSRFYKRVLGQASLGLGKSYMDKWWDCEAIEQFFIAFFERTSRRKPQDQKMDTSSGMSSKRS